MLLTTQPNSQSLNAAKSVELEKIVCSMIDLTMQLKLAHWNVTGSNFIALHQLFDDVYADVDGHVDTVAERVRQLGSFVHTNIQQVCEQTMLPKFNTSRLSADVLIGTISSNLDIISAACQNYSREVDIAGDPCTADMLIEIARALDKNSWFIISHTNGGTIHNDGLWEN